jgi:hypothetical protein
MGRGVWARARPKKALAPSENKDNSFMMKCGQQADVVQAKLKLYPILGLCRNKQL